MTKFQGELKFGCTVRNNHLAYLNSILGEDIREHPEWTKHGSLTFIDLELNADFDGIKWNEAEKTHDMCDAVNLVTELMRVRIPEFQFKGILKAQDYYDMAAIWELHISDDGTAFKVGVPINPRITVIQCPDCGHNFINE